MKINEQLRNMFAMAKDTQIVNKMFELHLPRADMLTVSELIDAEIERQSITDEDVNKAIEQLEHVKEETGRTMENYKSWGNQSDGVLDCQKAIDCYSLTITALEQMNKCDSCKIENKFVEEHQLANELFSELQEAKDALEQIRTEPCEYCAFPDLLTAHQVCYDEWPVSVNYCPNCGRKLPEPPKGERRG